jgi:TolA-binding protein
VLVPRGRRTSAAGRRASTGSEWAPVSSRLPCTAVEKTVLETLFRETGSDNYRGRISVWVAPRARLARLAPLSRHLRPLSWAQTRLTMSSTLKMGATLALAALGSFSLAAPALALPRGPESAPGVASRPSADDGDDEAAFIAGLADKKMHDMVVREATKFLERRAAHRRAPLVRYRLANALFDLGRFDEARPHFENLEKVAGFEQPDEVRFRLGQCELRRDAFAAAEEDFAAVAAGQAAYLKVPSTFLLGEARFRGGKFKEAAEAYGAVLKSAGAESYESDARHGLVWCAWRTKDGDRTVQAAEDFLKRHAADPRAGEVAFLAGEAHLDAGRTEDAERAYARVTAGDFRDAALRGLGFAAAARGDHKAAAARFGQLLSEFPASKFAAECALQQGVHLVRAGEMIAGLKVLERPPAVDDATNRFWRARALALVGDHEGALREAQAALKKSPDETLAVQLRIAAGDALFELGRGKEAAEMYESSGSAYALHAAAVAKLNAGDADEAERLARTLLDGVARDKGAPYRAESLLVRGEALFRLQRYGDAEPVLRAAVTEGDSTVADRARARLAWCDWFAGRHAAAARGFAQVADRAAAAAGATAQSGQSGTNGQSDATTESGATTDSGEEAAYMTARAWLEAGDTNSAKAAFIRYLDRYPAGANTPDALLRLSRLVPAAEAKALLARLAQDHGSAPEAERALFAIAEQKSAAGDHAGAAESWRLILARFPAGPNAHQAQYGLGWSLHQAGDATNAAEPLWALAQDKTATVELRTSALELLVWVERDAKRAPQSRDAFRALATAIKGDDARIVRAARVAAGALGESADHAGAAKLWDEVVPLVKDGAARGGALVEQGFARLDKGDLEGATAAVDEAANLLTAGDTAALGELSFFLGEGWYERNDDTRATKAFDLAALRGAPEVAERALYKAGFAELRAERPGEAAKRFAQLVERFPAGVFAGEAMFLVGETSFRAGDLDASVLWLKRHLVEAPKHAARPKALFRLGLVQGQRADWTGCASTLAELAAKHGDFPGLVEAELWRGRALSRQAQRRAARQALEGVTARNKGALAAAARVELGRLAEDEGDLDGALSEYLKVAVLYADPDAVGESLVRAGSVLERQNDRERADAQYRDVITRYPDSVWAAEAKKRLARTGG